MSVWNTLDRVAIAGEHFGEVRDMVETDEAVGHDEAALREVGAVRRQRDGRLQPRDMVVADVADDRAPATAASASANETRRAPEPTRL